MMNNYDPIDPDEICLHCGSLIDSNYRICPFCGQVWYVREEQNEHTRDWRQYQAVLPNEEHDAAHTRGRHRSRLGDNEQVG